MKRTDWWLLVTGVALILFASTAVFAQQLDRRNAKIYVLELDGKALTFGDFNESECQALLQALEPRVAGSRKLACVEYSVIRERIGWTGEGWEGSVRPISERTPPPMPSVVVIITCRVILGAKDHNSDYTGWRATEWDTEGGVLHCKRTQLELYDSAVDQGAAPQPFNTFHCMRAAMTQGPGFDVNRAAREKDLPAGARGWRFYKAGCPVPIMDVGPDGIPGTRDDRIIGWKIPDCGRPDGTMVCDGDVEI